MAGTTNLGTAPPMGVPPNVLALKLGTFGLGSCRMTGYTGSSSSTDRLDLTFVRSYGGNDERKVATSFVDSAFSSSPSADFIDASFALTVLVKLSIALTTGAIEFSLTAIVNRSTARDSVSDATVCR